MNPKRIADVSDSVWSSYRSGFIYRHGVNWRALSNYPAYSLMLIQEIPISEAARRYKAGIL